ncbi:MAG: ShlB/FhaC/HecB family hemolysin secretion/activation protein, partial [Okeania sp. SIO2F4]|uniref:ShlB/FhaC/HecB family hemolysin secretion/activation protein n=1 Tax=Okeania sp. SIO2F4 TaxID=2607790 RepID=UPI001429CC61
PCQRGEGSEFTITGKGGLPPNPSDPIPANSLWQEQDTPTTLAETITPSDQKFVEAQGWISTPNGIQLIVNPNTATPARPWLIPPDCKQLDSQQPLSYIVASTTGIMPISNSEPLQAVIQQFNFIGNTKFSNEELQQQLQPYLGKPITFAELIAARTTITQYYTNNNYITSGAFIPPQTISGNGTVTLNVVEGKVGKININIEGRLNEGYIKSRLARATKAPLNQEKLFSALQLLQLDPLVKTISAELSAGIRPDTSILDIEVVTANPWQIAAIANNGRAPSVGTFRRGGEVGYRNITGMGDSFNTLYTNTDGSDTVEISYSIPVNSSNGKVELFYRHQDNEIVESPFERLDINSNSNTYKLGFSQPIVQTPTQELSLGLAATRRDSKTSILGTNFPLSEGADDNGETKLSILQFFQDYQLRGNNQVLALNSQFNVGLDIFDATVNSNEADSRFFYWRGQGQWVRQLGEDTLLVVGADVQLSPSDLVPLERFGLGGYRSVRGYRQDIRLTDSGALGTVELRLPVPWISAKNRLFQVVPFIDGGVAWNSDGEEVPGNNALASVGLGLQVKLWDRINLRLDYGIPLVDVDDRDRTAQEDGLYFSVFSTPFSF